MKQYLLPKDSNFYKVNMHSHSTFSDGKQTPEEIKAAYVAAGYSAVAFTEHDILLDFSHLSDENFLAITAYEYYINSKQTPLTAFYEGAPLQFNDAETVHLNFYSKDAHDVRMVCYNPKYLFGNSKNYIDRAQYIGEPDYMRVFSVEKINEIIRAAKERDMLVVYNHPNWSLNNYTVYTALEGVDGLEIINGGSNLGSDMDDTPHVYDDLMRVGKRMMVVAGDDNHNIVTLGTGFTMVAAPSLSYENLMTALQNGDCYASNGPAIEELYFEEGRVHVKTSPAVGIRYYTAGRRLACRRATAAEPITTAEFEVKPEDRCFRIAVKDASGNHAYTRYYYLDELAKEQ